MRGKYILKIKRPHHSSCTVFSAHVWARVANSDCKKALQTLQEIYARSDIETKLEVNVINDLCDLDREPESNFVKNIDKMWRMFGRTSIVLSTLKVLWMLTYAMYVSIQQLF